MCSEHYSRVTLKPQAVALMDGSRSSGHSFSQQRPPPEARAAARMRCILEEPQTSWALANSVRSKLAIRSIPPQRMSLLSWPGRTSETTLA
jgi:hypothetical protein